MFLLLHKPLLLEIQFRPQSSYGNVNAAEPNQIEPRRKLQIGRDKRLRFQAMAAEIQNLIDLKLWGISTSPILCYGYRLKWITKWTAWMNMVMIEAIKINFIDMRQQELDHLPAMDVKNAFLMVIFQEEVLSVNLNGFETGKPYSRLSSEECLYGLKHSPRAWNSMAEQNVPTNIPSRTDEQIVPRSQWLIIGKRATTFSMHKKIQRNPSFKISCTSEYTNFFQAFTASANVSAIYLQ
ncbi:hypothetical protein Tco_0132489 [Tanacetum coccineum]